MHLKNSILFLAISMVGIFGNPTPIEENLINDDNPTFINTTVDNCGGDGICQPNLRLHVTVEPSPYPLNSNSDIRFTVSISNDGETSDGPIFRMQLDNNVNFGQVVMKQVQDGVEQPSTSLLQCEEPTPNSNTSLICEFIGMTFTTNQIIYFDVIVTPKLKTPDKSYFHFYMDIFDREDNELDETRFDNYLELDIQIEVDAGFRMAGYLNRAILNYNSTQFIDGTGPTNVHVYEIQNGDVEMSGIDLLFIWPYQTDDGDVVMELVEKPSRMKCEFLDYNAECDSYNGKPHGNRKNFVKKIYTHLYDVAVKESSENTMAFKCAILKCTSQPLMANAKLLIPLKFQYAAETLRTLYNPIDLSSVGELTVSRPHFWFKNTEIGDEIESHQRSVASTKNDLLIVGNYIADSVHSISIHHIQYIVQNVRPTVENFTIQLTYPKFLVRNEELVYIFESIELLNNSSRIMCRNVDKKIHWKLSDTQIKSARCDAHDFYWNSQDFSRAEVTFIILDGNEAVIAEQEDFNETACETKICNIQQLEPNDYFSFDLIFKPNTLTMSQLPWPLKITTMVEMANEDVDHVYNEVISTATPTTTAATTTTASTTTSTSTERRLVTVVTTPIVQIEEIDMGLDWIQPEITTTLPIVTIPTRSERITTESPYINYDCGPMYSKCRRLPFF